MWSMKELTEFWTHLLTPSLCGQTVPIKLFPSSAELLKMHKERSTVSLCVRGLELKVYLSLRCPATSVKRERAGARERGEDNHP